MYLNKIIFNGKNIIVNKILKIDHKPHYKSQTYKTVASPSSMHDTGCVGLVHWDDPEGWYGEGSGRGVQDGERVYPWRIHVDVWQN